MVDGWWLKILRKTSRHNKLLVLYDESEERATPQAPGINERRGEAGTTTTMRRPRRRRLRRGGGRIQGSGW
eukprot:9471351-Pyramimonas_sp.AAC.2